MPSVVKCSLFHKNKTVHHFMRQIQIPELFLTHDWSKFGNSENNRKNWWLSEGAESLIKQLKFRKIETPGDK